VDAATLPFDHSRYDCIRDMDSLHRWIAAARETGRVAFDTETTSLDEMRAELVGLSLSVEAGNACYIPVGHRTGGGDLFGASALADGQLPLDNVLAALKPLLQDPAVLKIGQNIKYDWKIMARHGIRIAPVADTMLQSYAMHAGLHGHGMDGLSETYLGHVPIPIKSLIGSGKAQVSFDRVPIEDAVKYAAEDADITLRLWQTFTPQLHKARTTTVYETLERPLVPVLAEMEMAGIQVDRDTLSRMSNAFAQKMAGLEHEIQEIAGRPFNVGSPKQLGEILFDEMGLPGGEKGKTGAWATGADVLEDITTLEDQHPQGARLAARILDWRQLSKLKSTYTDALQTAINPETGRVHTSYAIAGASTGRLASTDPNLQNIPVRTEEGRRIRQAFVAPPGRILVSLDYSQIELRILAHIADIPALKQAFTNGIDIHAMTASEMFNVPLDQMTPDIRRKAKAINFGVIYGISGFGLARNLRIPRQEAQAFIDRYFERFPGIRAYMDATVKFAQANGHVETLFGRRIHTPDINARGPGAGFARRAAINAPIQGTAADVIRRAMIRMPQAIAGLDAKMLLQVHDELLFEVAEGDADALTETARSVMQDAAHPAVDISVPLVVEAGRGANWAEAH
jgi:DNA polymerase-1